jgi:hypothetical protein
VVVVSREGEQELSPADLDFVSGVLKPRLRKIAGLPEHSHGQESDRRSRSDPPVIVRMRAFDDPVAGKLLMSSDRKATLIVLEVANDFFSRLNQPTIREIEDALECFYNFLSAPAMTQAEMTRALRKLCVPAPIRR